MSQDWDEICSDVYEDRGGDWEYIFYIISLEEGKCPVCKGHVERAAPRNLKYHKAWWCEKCQSLHQLLR